MRRSYAQFRFSPRPARIRAVRKFSWIGSINYVEDGAGRLETRDIDGEFAVELQNSDRFSVGITDNHEFVPQSFAITGVRVPVGSYDFIQGRTAFTFGQQRPWSGNLAVEYGSFYDGHLTTFGFSRTRINVSSQFSLEPTISINWLDLPTGSITSRLAGSRVTYTVTPLMFVSALVQYNSSNRRVSSNFRFRWEYQPGSELFVVYNDERGSPARSFPDLQNRALIVKLNRLFRF
jgi:hypothetical protein